MDKAVSKRSLPLSTALFPVPVILATCGDISGDKNAITLGWVGVASSDPPIITIGVRPTRYSYGLIQRYGDFVLNLPNADQVPILNYCGTVSGRNEDKFAKANLTAVKADVVRAPLIAEFAVNIECKVKDRISLGSHDMFIGEVVAVHADPSVVTGNRPDPGKASAIAYGLGRYYALGDVIERQPL